MSWESRLLELFDDLEQQAQALALSKRDVDVVELSRAAYAEVDLAGRLHASVGLCVVLTVTGVGAVPGRLAQVGTGWCLVTGTGAAGSTADAERIIVLAALLAATGLSPRATTPAARDLRAALGLGSVLRRLAEAGRPVDLVLLDGSRLTGVLQRVGGDFVEVAPLGAGRAGAPVAVPVVVPVAAVALLQRR